MKKDYYVEGVGHFYIRDMKRPDLDINKDYNSLEDISNLIEEVQDSMYIFVNGSEEQKSFYLYELSRRELKLRQLRDIKVKMMIELFKEYGIPFQEMIDSLTPEKIDNALNEIRTDNDKLDIIIKKFEHKGSN